MVKPNLRPATFALYEMTIRLDIAPALGKYPLKRLSVLIVESFLNSKIRADRSVRNVQIMRQVLSAALSRAVREELLARNVARVVELPASGPVEVVPYSPAEALVFLDAARDDPYTPHSACCCFTGCGGRSPRPALAGHRLRPRDGPRSSADLPRQRRTAHRPGQDASR